jgi:hypothetical protein
MALLILAGRLRQRFCPQKLKIGKLLIPETGSDVHNNRPSDHDGMVACIEIWSGLLPKSP